MKFWINKKLRIGLTVVLAIGIIYISFLLYREIKHPGFEEQQMSLFTYNNKGTVNYRVYLKPNALYDSNSMDEGELYISEFVDHIKTTFSYEFTGDKADNLRGNYNIIAKVQGYTIDREEVITIWQKDFPIIARKKFTIGDETMLIEEDIDIRLDEYNDFVTEILETSKINCQTNLNVIMDIHIEGDTGVGEIEETLSPSLIIPLNTPMFEIGGNTDIENPGAIEETRRIQLPVNRNLIIGYGIVIAILVLAIIFLIFFTEDMTDKDPFEKELRKLFKKHGDRFVALNSQISATCDDTYQVKSMDDLVRIADEIGKPILYKYSSDYKDINRFYVVDENEIYMLDFNNMASKEKSS